LRSIVYLRYKGQILALIDVVACYIIDNILKQVTQTNNLGIVSYTCALSMADFI